MDEDSSLHAIDPHSSETSYWPTSISNWVGAWIVCDCVVGHGCRFTSTTDSNQVNHEGKGFVASYEPMVRDVSVSIKHVEDGPLPNDGAIYPLWTFSEDQRSSGWTTVRYQDVMRMVPHAAIKRRPRCHTFRVFATGSTRARPSV